MKISIVKYKEGQERKDSWITYMVRRIKQNKNNLVAVIGQTGSGKTWSAISICEKISKEMNVPFNVDNIVFGLPALLKLINSGKLKSGSCIIFDEPQVSISSKEWQSKANKVFNYLVSTFRYKNLNMFFCTPYEDLLDKSTRKLFHSKFETVSINVKEKTTKLKPKIVQYNSHLQKFYEAFLRVNYKPENMSVFVVRKLQRWSVPKPSDEMIKAYEEKRAEWHKILTRDMEKEIAKYSKKKKEKNELKDRVVELVEKIGVKETAKLCDKTEMTIYRWLKEEREKINKDEHKIKANVIK